MQHLKTAALLSGPALLILLPAMVFGGWPAWAISALLVALLLLALWRSDTFLLRSLRAEPLREADAPGLFAIIRTLVHRQHLGMPTVHLLQSDVPNALLAAGTSGGAWHLVLTAGMLRGLNSSHLAAVVAHHASLMESGAGIPLTLLATYLSALNRVPGASFLSAILLRLIAPPGLKFQADASSAHLMGDSRPLLDALKIITAHRPGLISAASSHLWFCDPARDAELCQQRMARLTALALRRVLAVSI